MQTASEAENGPAMVSIDHALRMGPNTLLTRRETAHLLRTSCRSLERWASDGSGPRLVKIGPRRVGYRIEDVLEFLGASKER